MLSASRAVRPTGREATCLRCEAQMLFPSLAAPSRIRTHRSQRRQLGTVKPLPTQRTTHQIAGESRPRVAQRLPRREQRHSSSFTPTPKRNARLRPLSNDRSTAGRDTAMLFPSSAPATSTVRQRLAEWNEKFGQPGQTFLEEQGLLDPPTLVTRMVSPDDLRGQQDGDENKDREIEEAPFQDSQRDYDIEVTRKIQFRMGDLVELVTNKFSRETQLAVSLGSTSDGDFASIFITSRGRWLITSPLNAVYRLQEDYVPKNKCKEILACIPHANLDPTTLDMAQSFDLAVSREISAPVISKMLEFKERAEETYRLNSKSLDSAHDILAHQTDLRFGSLEKIAQKLLSKSNININDLFVIRKALIRLPEGFSFDARNHKETGMFQIRSKEAVEAIKLAQAWMRDWREQLVFIKAYDGDVSAISDKTAKINYQRVQSFIDKAAAIIDIVREKRHAPRHRFISDSTTAGPSKVKFSPDSDGGTLRFNTLPQFTANDVILIRFLETWSMSSDIDREASLSSLPPAIIRSTGKYEDVESSKKLGMTFLAEIGVFEPWINKQLYSSSLLLPMSQHSKPLQQLKSTLDKMTLKDVEVVDVMKDLRHDWGDLPAFAIDDASTEEVDDAISVERVEGKDDEFWMHAHIANPTAFLKSDSIFVRMAAHLSESFYSPERKFGMLPAWLSRDFLGLAKGRPCITFSSRINDKGQLLEAKVRNGTINNVISMTYLQLADVLGDTAPVKRFKLTIGDKISGSEANKAPASTARGVPDLDDKTLTDLKLLADIGGIRNRHRSSGNNTIQYAMEQAGVRVWRKNGDYGLLDSYPRRNHPVQWIGDPCIEIRSNPVALVHSGGSRQYSKSGILVQEAMLLAGESGGLWQKQRHIAGLFRCTDTIPGPNGISQQDYMQNVWNPAKDEDGLVPYEVVVGLKRATSATVVTAYPINSHVQIGLQQYQRLTSPLRRYGDMILHYQIESALRHEAQTGKMFDGHQEADKAALAFSERTITTMTARLRHRESLIRYENGQCEKHWIAHFFHRAIYYNECPLPPKFNVLIDMATSKVSQSGQSSFGWIMDLGVRVRLSEIQLHLGQYIPQSGDVIECEWHSTEVYNRMVYVRPIRVIANSGNLNQWLRENPPGADAAAWTGTLDT